MARWGSSEALDGDGESVLNIEWVALQHCRGEDSAILSERTRNAQHDFNPRQFCRCHGGA